MLLKISISVTLIYNIDKNDSDMNYIFNFIRIFLTCNLKMMQEASKRRCNKIKFISLSSLPKLFSQKILIYNPFIINWLLFFI